MGTQIANSIPSLYEQYAQSVTHRHAGEYLKYAKGDWMHGPNGLLLPIGTRLVAVMGWLMIGLKKWRDNQLVETRMGRLSDGYAPPRRDELDEQDDSSWEFDSQGNRRDPWSPTNTLPLVDEKDLARMFTFSTSSRGGFGAIGGLAGVYAKGARLGGEGQYPIVELGSDSYQHKDRSLGRIKFPTMPIVGWVDAKPYDAATAEALGEAEPPALADDSDLPF